MVGGALLLLVVLQRIQLKDNLLLGPWLQAMCHLRKGLICICRSKSECQEKGKAKPAKKTHASLLLLMYLPEGYQPISTKCMLWCCGKPSVSCCAMNSKKQGSAKISSLLLLGILLLTCVCVPFCKPGPITGCHKLQKTMHSA